MNTQEESTCLRPRTVERTHKGRYYTLRSEKVEAIHKVRGYTLRSWVFEGTHNVGVGGEEVSIF